MCIDLLGLDERLDVGMEDFTAVVSAGVTRVQLNHFIKDTGLFFPLGRLNISVEIL